MWSVLTAVHLLYQYLMSSLFILTGAKSIWYLNFKIVFAKSIFSWKDSILCDMLIWRNKQISFGILEMELKFQNLGVTSVTLSSGQTKTLRRIMCIHVLHDAYGIATILYYQSYSDNLCRKIDYKIYYIICNHISN